MDKTLILNKIKSYLKIEKNTDFAEFLEIKPTTLAMWYKRNTFDIELLFKKCEEINANWLLTGQGEMLKSEPQPAVSSPQPQENDKYISSLEKQIALLEKNNALQERENAYLSEKIKNLQEELAQLKK